MTKDRFLIDEIKHKVSLKQVIDETGGAELQGERDTFVGWHKAHESKSRTSLTVDNKKGVYHCFNCGQGGDIFSWAGHHKWNGSYRDNDKTMFAEILRDLAELAGVQLPEFNAEAAIERRSIEEIWQLTANFYHDQLTREHREFLQTRYGLTPATMDAEKIGYAPTGRVTLQAYLSKTHSIDASELLKSGLFHQLDNGSIQDLFQGRFMFPYWRGGRVTFFIGRITEESPQWEHDNGMKYKKLLVHNDKHSYVSPQVRNAYFYGEDAARGASELFITEGVTDCLLANQSGFPCISPGTVLFKKTDWPRLLELTATAKIVYIVNDNENNAAGSKGAQETAEMLWMHGRMAKLVTLPKPEGIDKIDLNDFLRAQGPEAFKTLLSTSKTILDLQLESVKNATNDEELIEAQKAAVALIAQIDDKFVQSKWCETMPAKLGIGKQQYSRFLKDAIGDIKRAQAEVKAQDRAQQKQSSTLPTIQVNNRQLSENAQDALSAIISRNETDPTTFIRGGSLVRIVQDERGQYSIQDLNYGSLLKVLAESAEWIEVTLDQFGQAKRRAAHPSKNVVNVTLNDGEWAGMPPLVGVVTSPVFSHEGILHDKRGYSEDTGLFYTGGVKLGDTTPTDKNVKAAKALILDDLLVDFPFKDDASKAHAVAFMLLPFVRDMIRGPTPVHVNDSPTAGTGKGLNSNACALPFLGHDIPTMAAAKDDEEWRKRITTSLMNGSTHIAIDNVNHEIDSGVLASAFTQPLWEDRALGSNRMVKIPIRTVWAITANNIKMSQEIARRCIWIRLDANVEKPWERTGFKHPRLIEWVHNNRDALVTAAITLVQAWIDKGMPKYIKHTKGSYEAWAGVMGGILEAVGISGFLENELELYDRVVSSNDTLADFVTTWWDKYKNMPTSTHDLFKLASFSDNEIENKAGGWNNLLGDLLKSPKQRGRQTQLGNLLSAHQDKVVAGHKIVFSKSQRGVGYWELEADQEVVEPHQGSTTECTILPQENYGNANKW